MMIDFNSLLIIVLLDIYLLIVDAIVVFSKLFEEEVIKLSKFVVVGLVIVGL